MYLHAVRIQLTRGRDATELLDLKQALSQGRQLIVDWQQCLRDRLGCKKQLINDSVALAQ